MSSNNRARYAAALQDCEELLKRLQQKPKVDFEIFAQVWRDMTFSLIFCGRTTEEDLLEFTNDLFLAAKSCWLPPHSSTQRLLASYLVYGLYFKQPVKHAHKYKVTKKEWVEICEYFDFVKSREDLPEHYYMFCKMVECDAFRFCATPYEVNLDKKKSRANCSNDLSVLTKEPAVSGAVQKIVSQSFYDNISKVETKYEQSKKQVLESFPELASGFPAIASKDLGEKLRSICSRRALDNNNEPSTSAFPSTNDAKKTEVNQVDRRLVLVAEPDEESEWSTEEDEPSDDVPRAKRRCRERGYRMVKNFRQRKEMRFVQGDDSYQCHSKSKRSLHHGPMHNFMAGTRPHRLAPEREKRQKLSLDYLAKGIQYAKQAIRKHALCRTKNQREVEDSQDEQPDRELLGSGELRDDQDLITESGKDREEKICGTLRHLSMGGEKEASSVDDKASAAHSSGDSINRIGTLDMPYI